MVAGRTSRPLSVWGEPHAQRSSEEGSTWGVGKPRIWTSQRTSQVTHTLKTKDAPSHIPTSPTKTHIGSTLCCFNQHRFTAPGPEVAGT